MRLKPLGSSGLSIPELGVGTWQYTAGPAALRSAIDLGVAFIDTAEFYANEAIIGEAMRGLRERVFIATKVWKDNLRYDDVLAAADRSLRALGTDRIDLYQIHWPNRDVPLEETIGAMEALVDAGKVHHIGVSNFDRPLLQRAQRAATKHPIVSNQVPYNLIDRRIELELLPYCAAEGVTVIAYSPLATKPATIAKHDRGNVLARIAAETNHSVAQVALNWCVSKPGVVAIPKANSIARIEENLAASGWTLTAEQLALLDTIDHEPKSDPLSVARRGAGRVLRTLGLK